MKRSLLALHASRSSRFRGRLRSAELGKKREQVRRHVDVRWTVPIEKTETSPAPVKAEKQRPARGASDVSSADTDSVLLAEYEQVRKKLQEYEAGFLLTDGRPVMSYEDLGDMGPLYRRYRRLKQAIHVLRGER